MVRTRIGSPYVVSAMAATDPDEGPIAGFEANGGFLTESDLRLGGAVLPRLPTRDAILPIIAVLKLAVEEKQPLSKLADELPSRVMKADRLKDVDPATGASWGWIASSLAFLAMTGATTSSDGMFCCSFISASSPRAWPSASPGRKTGSRSACSSAPPAPAPRVSCRSRRRARRGRAIARR